MLGKLIGDIRVSKRITLQELCAGLCEERMLRKYENGEVEIEKLMADALMQRLGKSMDKYDVLLNTKEYQLAKNRTHIQELLRRGKLVQAEIAIRNYERELPKEQKLHQQFLLLQKAELLRRTAADTEQQRFVVQEAIKQTIELSAIMPDLLMRKCFRVMEIMLFTRYAILLEELGEKNEALEWYQRLMIYLEQNERDLSDKAKLYPLVAYQLAKYYASQKRYEQVGYYIGQACSLLSQAKTQSVLYVRLLELKFEVAENAECVFVAPEEKACCETVT